MSANTTTDYTSIRTERTTTTLEEPITVFLIGMRVNQFLPPAKWWKVAQAMPKMLDLLLKRPEKGMLHAESFFRLFPLTTILVSYWRSPEDLAAFARDPQDPHLKAWQDFQRQIGSDGSVGIWHETYTILPHQAECIYANMPLFGLAAATGQPVAATGALSSFQKRLKPREPETQL